MINNNFTKKMFFFKELQNIFVDLHFFIEKNNVFERHCKEKEDMSIVFNTIRKIENYLYYLKDIILNKLDQEDNRRFYYKKYNLLENDFLNYYGIDLLINNKVFNIKNNLKNIRKFYDLILKEVDKVNKLSITTEEEAI